MQRYALLLSLLLPATCAIAQLAPSAPADQAKPLTASQLSALDSAIAPYVAQARKSFPAARARFLQGLPPGEAFYVTAPLKDANGHVERVFIRVKEIRGMTISGQIASKILLVEGFKAGQAYSLEESDLVDWLISMPDGSEEGNVVGKFLDTYQP